MIGVINYRAGNGPSVLAAFRRLGVHAELVETPQALAAAERIVLPGVGSADATMSSLREMDLLSSLNSSVRRERKPFLGVCVGLQVLFEASDEGNARTLGWLPGRVTRFDSREVRVPQMGWNRVDRLRRHPIFEGVPDDAHMYFVNSFHARVAVQDHLLATSDYAGPATAAVADGNVVATQFHIEKSGPTGLRMLANFARWSPSC